MNILDVNNLRVSYGKKLILEDLNFYIKENEIICLMGNSGCGKSTLISTLNGFLSENGGSYSGDIFFKGNNIKNMKLSNLRRSIGTLFQDSKPFDITIEKNLTYVMEYYGKKDRARIKEILEDVNLYDEVKDKMHSKARDLSGGQKQRLCIARMLTTMPSLLIFDEPCSSLDLKNTLIIEGLFKRMAKKYTILISTHDLEQAERLADRIFIIENKKLKER